jgi:hypothetical protein
LTHDRALCSLRPSLFIFERRLPSRNFSGVDHEEIGNAPP